MLSKGEIECCKKEAKDYIDFVSDKDNAGWLKGLLWYIEQLESDNYELNNRINDYIEERRELIEKLEEEKYTIESTYSQINGNYFMAQDKLDLINEILSILKGEVVCLY